MLDYATCPQRHRGTQADSPEHPLHHGLLHHRLGQGIPHPAQYMRPEGCNLTATELHQLAIRKAMSMYDKLLGISSDKQCQDMVRSCGLAYDPEAYFNWNAEVLPITREEVGELRKSHKATGGTEQEKTDGG